MFTDEIRAFLQKPFIARLSTLDRNGYPHTIPIWYMLDGDDIVFISDRNTFKVRYIQANPKGAVAIGGDTNDGAGYLIKGDYVIEEDPDRYWLKTVTYRYESGAKAETDIAEWTKLDMILIRLKPKKIAKVI